MRCPSCDHDNRVRRRFCAGCGVALAAACASCGASSQPGEKFCGGCGERLPTVAPAPGAPTPAPEPEAALPAGERRQLTVPFCGPVHAGQARSMRKLVFLCRRRQDVTHERYVELLLGGHVPIALRHHPAMRKYVVNVVERQQAPGSADLDSVGELSFDTLEDYRERLYDSPEGREVVARDVAGFMGGAHAYECTEHVQKDLVGRPAQLPARSPVVKMVAAMKRRPGTSHAEFVTHWLERHVPLALEHHVGLVKYVNNVVDARLSPDGEELDGIAELCFASEADLRTRLYGSEEGRRVIEADIARFLGPTQAWIVAEHVCKLP